MPNIDDYEAELLSAYDAGEFKSVATTAETERLKAAARATAIQLADPADRSITPTKGDPADGVI